MEFQIFNIRIVISTERKVINVLFNFKKYVYCFVSVQISPAVLEVEGEGGLAVSPAWVTARPVPSPTSRLKKLRLKAKDYRKGGDGLRGKNVTEAYRVKEKDLKRTMK